jgi:hypothetical protein
MLWNSEKNQVPGIAMALFDQDPDQENQCCGRWREGRQAVGRGSFCVLIERGGGRRGVASLCEWIALSGVLERRNSARF